MGRKSKGRKKVEMVKIKNETNLQVTFSKRRSGLFKKASELCTLCGAEVAIVVFSPGRKVFSFGHPCVRTLIQRFLNAGPVHPHQNSATMRIVDAHRDATVRDLNLQLTLTEAQLEMEQKKSQELKELEKENQGKNWWESPIEELNMTQLDQLESALEDLKKSVAIQTENLLIQPTGPQSLFHGSSSTNNNNNNFNSFGNNSLNRPFSFNTHSHSHSHSHSHIPDYRSGFGNVSDPDFEFKPVFNPSYNQGFGPGFF